MVGFPLLPTLLWDCFRASLFEAGVAENLVQYSLLTVRVHACLLSFTWVSPPQF